MALSELQQAISIIDKASSLLLITPAKASRDSLASMIAIYLSLQPPRNNQTDKLIDEVSPSHLPRNMQFLAGSAQIKTEPTMQPEIVIDIADSLNISNIRQEQLRSSSRIHLSFAPSANITKDQIETSIRALPYEAVVVIGASDLEELGDTFTKNADFFYNTPIINIDHQAANEHFGTVNLVDVTAGSLAEIVYQLILDKNTQIHPDIATALYTGIISGTDSFQRPSTTPRSFQVAAKLIEQKANREDVIQHLIKTKPLNLIKLIGSIYARLRHEDNTKLYWTVLEATDFIKSGATAYDVPTAMQELANNIAGFNAAFLLYESPSSNTTHDNNDQQFFVYLLLGKGLKQRRQEIQEILSASRENGAITFTITAPSVESAEKIAHDKIKQILP
jgi:nanoRNase/pAp phosphatase (c-di-AMP/oligoRNAs hydrolase)